VRVVANDGTDDGVETDRATCLSVTGGAALVRAGNPGTDIGNSCWARLRAAPSPLACACWTIEAVDLCSERRPELHALGVAVGASR
jgi:hypothetical protein